MLSGPITITYTLSLSLQLSFTPYAIPFVHLGIVAHPLYIEVGVLLYSLEDSVASKSVRAYQIPLMTLIQVICMIIHNQTASFISI